MNGSGNDRLDWESVRRTLASERRRYPTIPNDRMNRAGEYAFRRLLACLAVDGQDVVDGLVVA